MAAVAAGLAGPWVACTESSSSATIELLAAVLLPDRFEIRQGGTASAVVKLQFDSLAMEVTSTWAACRLCMKRKWIMRNERGSLAG